MRARSAARHIGMTADDTTDLTLKFWDIHKNSVHISPIREGCLG